MLKFAMNRHYFVQDTSFNNLEDEYELETGSVLTEKANRVPPDPPYNTCSARSW